MNDMMTTGEVQRELRITRRQQAELRQRRELVFYLIGHRTILYRRADVEAFLAKRRVKAVAP